MQAASTDRLREADQLLRGYDVSREVPESPRELRLVRDVGHGLPSAKAPYGRRFADGGYERRRVRVVSHRLEDVRLEQADAILLSSCGYYNK